MTSLSSPFKDRNKAWYHIKREPGTTPAPATQVRWNDWLRETDWPNFS